MEQEDRLYVFEGYGTIHHSSLVEATARLETVRQKLLMSMSEQDRANCPAFKMLTEFMEASQKAIDGDTSALEDIFAERRT